MTLFNDTELFTAAAARKTVFDLPDCDLVLYEGFFDKPASDQYYDYFLNYTVWQEYEMQMFDKVVRVPRMVAWYGDSENIVTEPTANYWTPELATIRAKIEEEIDVPFNSVLLNLYRDGKDGVAWHSDTVRDNSKNTIIASVTFGDTRMFRLRHKFRKDLPQVEIPLHHRSFLLMAGTTQSFWQHQVPKTARNVLPRINLTFRQQNTGL